jgi:hypothetical protein
MQEIRAYVPEFGMSFQNDQRAVKRIVVQEKLQKVENV